MTRLSSFGSLFVCAFALACSVPPGGGGGGGGEGGGEGDATAAISFLGTWSGTFKNKDAEEGSALRETTANATFTADEESSEEAPSGAFAFTFPDLKDVKVTGTFRDFGARSLMLTVAESNISVMGNKGSKLTFDYQVIGGGLELTSERVRLLLEKTSGATPKNPATTVPSHPYVGRWACSDAGGRAWAVHMKSITKFSADIRLPDEPSIWYDGAVELLPDGDANGAKLTVISSNVAKYEGSILYFTRNTDVTATITRGAEAMPCDKKAD